MKGLKTGGREKGTPNRNTKGIAELLAEKYPDYHPVIALAEIANDLANEITVRLYANKEVAKYICPQLKSMDINLLNDLAEEGTPQYVFDLSKLSDEQLDRIEGIHNILNAEKMEQILDVKINGQPDFDFKDCTYSQLERIAGRKRD